MPYQKIDSQYLDELLGSKLTWRLLRVLVMHPFLSFRLTDLASRLKTSNKSILRIIRKLSEKGLVLGAVGKHDRYRINPDIRMTRKIWSIFMSERIQHIPKEIIDVVYPYFERIKDRIEAFIICEYPSPDGMLIFKDTAYKDTAYIAIVSDTSSLDDIGPIPSGLNTHLFTKQKFSQLDDPIAQSALLEGIVLHGEDFVFSLLSSLKSFPQLYLIEKTDTYSKALAQADSLTEELQRQQYELIEKNVHDFETQLDIRENRNNQKPLLDRMDNLKAVIAKNSYGKYL